MDNKVNLIFMGGFTYPRGMAATKRIQNVINALKELPDVETRVIIQRQSTLDDALSGVFENTPYETIIGDLFRAKMLVALPVLYYKTITAVKRAFKPSSKNVIYFYGPIFIDSIVPLYYAKRLGYTIIFDVIEDFGLAKDVSRSFYQYARSKIANRISSQIRSLASGIIVISSYLEKKSRSLTQGRVPLHYMSISVDMAFFPRTLDMNKPIKTLFYAGSFGKKDGVPILLDAFDNLAERHDNIYLVLTGRGDSAAMNEFFARVDTSPYKDRIDYKGYLDEKDYYSFLNDADIPCMTRVDLAFAQAGFPFKLGEYLATGKPVIASRVSDVDRFLKNKDNAMLVKAGSSKEVCQAVEFLINDHSSAKAIGERGRETAITYFNNKQQGIDLLDFIRSL